MFLKDASYAHHTFDQIYAICYMQKNSNCEILIQFKTFLFLETFNLLDLNLFLWWPSWIFSISITWSVRNYSNITFIDQFL